MLSASINDLIGHVGDVREPACYLRICCQLKLATQLGSNQIDTPASEHASKRADLGGSNKEDISRGFGFGH